jgi:hypothetical protein
MRELCSAGMSFSVDLDDEARRHTGEVGDIGSDRVLPAKALPINRIVTQARPQDDFRISHSAPKVLRQCL